MSRQIEPEYVLTVTNAIPGVVFVREIAPPRRYASLELAQAAAGTDRRWQKCATQNGNGGYVWYWSCDAGDRIFKIARDDGRDEAGNLPRPRTEFEPCRYCNGTGTITANAGFD